MNLTNLALVSVLVLGSFAVACKTNDEASADTDTLGSSEQQLVEARYAALVSRTPSRVRYIAKHHEIGFQPDGRSRLFTADDVERILQVIARPRKPDIWSPRYDAKEKKS